jgi:hypothetical protein
MYFGAEGRFLMQLICSQILRSLSFFFGGGISLFRALSFNLAMSQHIIHLSCSVAAPLRLVSDFQCWITLLTPP